MLEPNRQALVRFQPQSADVFRKFDENELAFLYQDEKASGEGSTFFKLVRRDGS